MTQFFQTGYGRAFFSAQLPALIKALERIADALKQKDEAPAEPTFWGAQHVMGCPHHDGGYTATLCNCDRKTDWGDDHCPFHDGGRLESPQSCSCGGSITPADMVRAAYLQLERHLDNDTPQPLVKQLRKLIGKY